MKATVAVLLLVLLSNGAIAQSRPPIIDMHLHASPVDSQDPPPGRICAPINHMPMKVKRIVSNTATSDLKSAKAFYEDVLGLELIMDHGWFRTYGSDAKMTVQVSFGSEGGSGTPVPDLSIEVDDIDAALSRFDEANVAIEYGPVSEPWGVRRFYVRDPFGKLINILQHE